MNSASRSCFKVNWQFSVVGNDSWMLFLPGRHDTLSLPASINPTTEECLCIIVYGIMASKKQQVAFEKEVVILEEVLIPDDTLDPALRPQECVELDFSLPSSAFAPGEPAALPAEILDRPAHSSLITRVLIRIPSARGGRGLCSFHVVHDGSAAQEPVTVGDVLTAIHRRLREAEPSNDPEVLKFCADRIAQSAQPETERAFGTRRIDHLLGKVLFAGIVIPPQQEPWHVELD
ncbi:hypothetical protein C8R46DRAFT_352149 [Mycena filopes]|nr:hypothetical protein C8R46DRAFT_1284142 [Mycena filopes]KAJ7161742.1 hypothetical protein C8R46DRAFT_352149 [Mycena filopes]